MVGTVTTVKGGATAQLPGEEPRPLACGDPVFEKDQLVTADASHLGVLMGDVLTHMSEKTAVKVDHTAAGTPDATLERGKLRMIDSRDGGAPARLAALDASAAVSGTDTEAYLFAEKVGPYAMMCEWDAPLVVTRPNERAVASPGNCVISKKTEPLYTAQAHEHRIPALAAEACEIDPGLLAALAGSPANHLSPLDVAAPGPSRSTNNAGLGTLTPALASTPVRSACDDSCGVSTPTLVVEPQPGVGGVGLN